MREERFKELARGKAERDSELLSWTEKQVIAFEKSYTAPVKTGSDLLRVVATVLKDIQFHLDKGDVTSRPLLQAAKDEDEVRNWIVEQNELSIAQPISCLSRGGGGQQRSSRYHYRFHCCPM